MKRVILAMTMACALALGGCMAGDKAPAATATPEPTAAPITGGAGADAIITRGRGEDISKCPLVINYIYVQTVSALHNCFQPKC